MTFFPSAAVLGAVLSTLKGGWPTFSDVMS